MMRLLTPFLSILAAILLYVFFVSPRYADTADIKKNIDQYKAAITAYNEFTTTLNGKLDIINGRTTTENERLNRLVPSEIDTARLLVDIESIAKSKGLLFGNISTTESKGTQVQSVPPEGSGESSDGSSAQLNTVDITFDVIGSYDQFKLFLHDLESSLTLFEITSLDFAPVEKIEQGSLQQFSVTIRTYSLPKNNTM